MKSMISHFEIYLMTEKRVSNNTLDAYRRDLAQLLTFLEAHKITMIHEVTTPLLKNFLKELHTQGIAARSLSRKISTLKAFFSYVHVYHGYDNIAGELVFPKLEKKLPEYLTESEIETILMQVGIDQSLAGIRNKLIMYLLYVSGMRVTELAELSVSHIQFETGLVTVTGKGDKQRVIPLIIPIMEMIRNYVQTFHAELQRKWGITTDLLFPIRYGKRIKSISRQNIWAIVKKVCTHAGIRRTISPHTFRHSLATHMLQKGADIRSLQLLLGHESIATVQIYTHVDTSYVRTVYDKKHPRS